MGVNLSHIPISPFSLSKVWYNFWKKVINLFSIRLFYSNKRKHINECFCLYSVSDGTGRVIGLLWHLKKLDDLLFYNWIQSNVAWNIDSILKEVNFWYQTTLLNWNRMVFHRCYHALGGLIVSTRKNMGNQDQQLCLHGMTHTISWRITNHGFL